LSTDIIAPTHVRGKRDLLRGKRDLLYIIAPTHGANRSILGNTSNASAEHPCGTQPGAANGLLLLLLLVLLFLLFLLLLLLLKAVLVS
jgi:hypothetical protein